MPGFKFWSTESKGGLKRSEKSQGRERHIFNEWNEYKNSRLLTDSCSGHQQIKTGRPFGLPVFICCFERCRRPKSSKVPLSSVRQNQ